MAFPRPEPLGQSSTPQSGAGGFRPTSVYVNGISISPEDIIGLSPEDIGLKIPAGPVSALAEGATVDQVAGAVNDLIAALITAGVLKANVPAEPEPEPNP